MTGCGVLSARGWVLGALWLLLATPPARAGDLTGADALVRVYDAILDARFDSAEAELARTCPALSPKIRRSAATSIGSWRTLTAWVWSR